MILLNRLCDLSRDWECWIAVYVWLSVSPVLIIVGTVGNLLSLAVLSRRAMSGTTTSVYLRFLAVADLASIYSSLLGKCLYKFEILNIMSINDVACRLSKYVVFMSFPLSAFLLAATTVDRALLVKCPLWHRVHCSRKSSVVVSLIIVFSLLISNGHILLMDTTPRPWTRFVNETNTTIVYAFTCTHTATGYSFFWKNIWPKLILAVYCMLPACCLSVSNVAICRELRRSRDLMRAVGSNLTGVVERARRTRSITLMLVTVSVYFVVSGLPICIHFIMKWTLFDDVNVTLVIRKELINAIAFNILCSNNALNFIFYCYSGSAFRQEFKRMFGR